MREFGRLQLARAEDVQEAERLLQVWAVEFAGDANDRLFTVAQVATMRRIRAEEGNLARRPHAAPWPPATPWP